jgi:UDP-glucose:(glucosyl)LPS alpha-1,3-glucosyltransferase
MTTSQEKPSFHIAFCVDNHYFRSMGATMTSIIDNNPGIHFIFHVLTFAASEDNRARLAELEKRYGVETRLHVLDPAIFHKFNHFIEFSYYSLSIFTRLVIPRLLKGVTDTVLYLDADILCVGKIDPLLALDMRDQIAAVVPDAEITTQRRCAALGLKHPRYFNGGVMYVNVNNWLKHDITDQAMHALLHHGKKLRFNDQDALNIVLDGRALFIEKRWNYIYDLIYDLDRNSVKMRPMEDPVFIHFAGAVKPWAEWSGHDSRAMFKMYHAMSPWADLPLDPAPRNSREMRMQSRFMMKRGDVLQGIRWYIKYLRARSRR